MTARQARIIVISLGIAVALTRLLAAAHSLWEWDETLFCLSLRDFNVAAHHPHPPGFPLYVLLGKLFRLFIHDDFRALRDINLISAMLVFPGTYLLARELRFELWPSIHAALLTSFAPNVWFYGGTAFSDEPALAMLLFGAALLLRGRTSRGAYFAGCVVMAAACVMRPQNVLLGAYPWLAASWPRWKERKLDAIAGLVVMIVICAGFFGGAAYFTGFDAYRNAVKVHGEYVMRVDSYHNPDRIAWYRTSKQMLLDPYGAGRVSAGIAVFAAIGFLRFRRPIREALAIFGPFVLFSLFMLDVDTGGRYATTSMPLLMICSAEGVRLLAVGAGRVITRWRAEIAQLAVQSVVVAAILTRLIRWTLPALAEVRTHDAPTVVACRWIHQHLDRTKTTLYVHGSMAPWADYLLHDYKQVPTGDDYSPMSLGDMSNSWLVAEGMTATPDAINFVRPRGHLFNISRKRYFEVSVRPLLTAVRFGSGWYDEEGGGDAVWRWMGRESTTYFAPMRGKAELTIKFKVPLDAEPRKPVATFAMNGVVIDRVVCNASMKKTWVVPPKASGPNVLTIEVDEVANPAAQHLGGDPRDLGLQLLLYSWRPLEGK